jgi:hypothetical protein
MRGTYLVPAGRKLSLHTAKSLHLTKEICVCLNAATEAWIEPQVSFCQTQAGHAVNGFEVSGDLGSKGCIETADARTSPFC